MKRLVTVGKDGLLRLPEEWLELGGYYRHEYTDKGMVIYPSGVHYCRTCRIKGAKRDYKYPAFSVKLPRGKYVAELFKDKITVEAWHD